MTFKELFISDKESIASMSELASAIVKDYYDPIIGSEQNDYMIKMFQSAASIEEQLSHGYRYFFMVNDDGTHIGFMAFYKRDDELYLSKLYLERSQRGKGYAKDMLCFLVDQAKAVGARSITLNVNKNNPTTVIYEKLGFKRLRDEKNDIGNGFYMDDYVYGYVI